MGKSCNSAVQSLSEVEKVVVSWKWTCCCRTVYTASSKEHGTLLTFKQNLSSFIVKDVKSKTVGTINMGRRWLQPLVFEVLMVQQPLLRIRRMCCCTVLLITDEQGDEILRLKRGCFLYNRYKIIAEDGKILGKIRWSIFQWKYTITWPKDLDVNYKMALTCVPLYHVAKFPEKVEDTTDHSKLRSIRRLFDFCPVRPSVH